MGLFGQYFEQLFGQPVSTWTPVPITSITILPTKDVMDQDGGIWQFSNSTNTWNYVGTIGSSGLANEEQSGLVDPNSFNRLQTLKATIGSINNLKIYPGLDSYYYFLKSGNHTVKFSPESNQDLRIEVNRQRLLTLLSQIRCPGQRGPIGPIGPTGATGQPGPNEILYDVIPNGMAIDISVPIISTIGTPLSFRLFMNTIPILTIIVNLDGTYAVTIQNLDVGVEIDTTRTYFDITGDQLTAEVVALANWPEGNWQFKIGQLGRKGLSGANGSSLFRVVSDSITDPALRATEAIITLRTGDENGVLYQFKSALFSANCVSRLAISNICQISDIDCLATAKMMVGPCKPVGRYCFSDDPVVPLLNLPSWTPSDSCVSQRLWSSVQFRWTDFTSVGYPWQQANNPSNVDSIYPWPLAQTKDPGQRNCQEDFFYCQNVNDSPCNVVSEAGPLAANLANNDGICYCDCPIELLLPYLFNDILVGDEGVIVNNYQAAVCTLRGIIDEYNANVFVDCDADHTLIVAVSVEYDDLCGGVPSPSPSPAPSASPIPSIAPSPSPVFIREAIKKAEVVIPNFRLAAIEQSDNFEWRLTDTSPIGNLQRVNQVVQEGNNGNTLSLIYTGSKGAISLQIAVNMLRVSPCKAYRVSIQVMVQ